MTDLFAFSGRVQPGSSLVAFSGGLGSPWVLGLLASSPFDPIYNTLGTLLAGFYAMFSSFGVAIALLTIAVRVLLIPLTVKQIRSQQAMQKYAPQLKALQTKHKGDRAKLQEETMRFYKEHSFNPFGGCLPMLLQAPLFIVLYRLIEGLSRVTDGRVLHVPLGTRLYEDLFASGGRMLSWGMDLSLSATKATTFSTALPAYTLIALVMATGYLQQKQLSARLPKDGINAQMAVIGKVFPLFMGVISLSIPAGVVVYFLFSNLWQIGQQKVAFRNQPLPDSTPETAKPSGDNPGSRPKGRGLRAMLAEAAEASGGSGGSTKAPKNGGAKTGGTKNGGAGNGGAGNGGAGKPNRRQAGGGSTGSRANGSAGARAQAGNRKAPRVTPPKNTSAGGPSKPGGPASAKDVAKDKGTTTRSGAPGTKRDERRRRPERKG
ncbi:MAG: YidC/Oxa1 family membrane protein insertase [Acidimicrobiales bacterium]